jgi:seryl-tRNA synthetase
MLDRKLILSDPQRIADNCARRGVSVDVQQIVGLEAQRLEKLKQAEELNRQANDISSQIPKAKDNDERQKLIADGKQIRQSKDVAQKEHDEIDVKITALLSTLPNLTHPEVPDGGEEDSKELFVGKTPIRKFDFKPLDHVDLGAKHDLFDFESAARVAGSGFYYLKNAAVRLDMALQMFAISFLQDKGFTPITTPDLALTSILEGIGFNPRGPETQIYSIENTELNLVGTAEITLGGMLAGQTIDTEELPLRLCGLSHCFRTEAGAAGRASKGLYRVHQFTKVEMFAFTSAEQSDAMHLELRDLESTRPQAI